MVGLDKNTGSVVYRQNLGNIGKGFKGSTGVSGGINGTPTPAPTPTEKGKIDAYGLNSIKLPEDMKAKIVRAYSKEDIMEYVKAQKKTPDFYIPPDVFFEELKKDRDAMEKINELSAAEIEAGVKTDDTTTVRNEKMILDWQKNLLKEDIKNWKKEPKHKKEEFLQIEKNDPELTLLTDTEIDQIFNELNPKKDRWWNPFN